MAPGGRVTVRASPPSPGRARAAPDQRNLRRPLRPVQHPPARVSSVIRLRPNPARTSSTTFTRAGPSTATMRRKITARCGSACMARASRHSVRDEPTQRLRQIRVPVS